MLTIFTFWKTKHRNFLGGGQMWLWQHVLQKLMRMLTWNNEQWNIQWSLKTGKYTNWHISYTTFLWVDLLTKNDANMNNNNNWHNSYITFLWVDRLSVYSRKRNEFIQHLIIAHVRLFNFWKNPPCLILLNPVRLLFWAKELNFMHCST